MRRNLRQNKKNKSIAQGMVEFTLTIPSSTSTSTSVVVNTPTTTPIPTIIPTSTTLPTTPGAPLNPQGGATKNGNKCKSIWFRWSTNPSWLSNPGIYPITYQTYKNSIFQTSLMPNDPSDTTWNTGISLNHNSSVTLSVFGVFPGVIGSYETWGNFYCYFGNLIQTGSGVYP